MIYLIQIEMFLLKIENFKNVLKKVLYDIIAINIDHFKKTKLFIDYIYY